MSLLGSRGGDGGTEPLDVDPQDASQERQGAQMRASDALPQPVDGPGIEPVQGSPGGQAAPPVPQVGCEQVVQGLGGGALACHGRTNSRKLLKKQSPPLDNVGQIADAWDVEKAPTDGVLADAPVGADQNPCEELAMTNANQPVPTEQVCRDCGEPLTLLELREMQCEQCEDEQRERARAEAWESHLEDVAEIAAMDRAEFGR